MNIKKNVYLAILTIIPLLPITAQDNNVDLQDSCPVDIDPFDSIVAYLPESLDADLHELLEKWHISYFSKPDGSCIGQNENPYFPDSVYRKRMESLPFIIPMTYNKTVRNCIDVYAQRLRNSTKYIMGMADFYFPMIEQKLDINELPLELKYLAVVESALNPIAQSRVGASGLWQFMLRTGKAYNLEINSLIDERFDPEKATDAACKYFKDMYKLYGNWHLVIAAYNCGPGNVNKAIRRSGGSKDFWEIYKYLPRETRSYVPLFMAVSYVMTYHKEHNICPVRAELSVATDTIMVERTLHFGQIADILQMDKETIRFYNPHYKREIIPGKIKPSVLRLPVKEALAFIDNEGRIYGHRTDELLANQTPVTSEKREEKIIHRVKSGESLSKIANRYGVSSRDLRRWNGLRSSRIRKGSRLKVYVDNGGLAHTSKTKSKTPSRDYISYKVKSGDSLYVIAKKYPGITAKNIQNANGMRGTRIRPGQMLKIPRG